MSSGGAQDGADAAVFDTRVLTEALPAAETGGLRDEAGRSGLRMATVVAVFQSSVLVLGVGVLALLFVLVFQSAAGGSGLTWASVVIAAIMVMPLAVSRFGAMPHLRRGAANATYRLERFVSANRLDMHHRQDDPEETATVFTLGKRRRATAIVEGSEPRPFVSATYSFDTWVARTRMPHSLTYLRVGLAAGVPRASLIRVRAPGARSWSPPTGQQRIDIGEGFDEHVAVWCAPADSSDVRRMLTPSVRAGLLTAAPDVDVETVGQRVYFLSRQGLPRHTAAYWRWVEDLFVVAQLLEDVATDRPEPSPRSALLGADDERARRRAELFTTPRIGRPVVIGCLLPAVFGVVAAVLTASWH